MTILARGGSRGAGEGAAKAGAPRKPAIPNATPPLRRPRRLMLDRPLIFGTFPELNRDDVALQQLSDSLENANSNGTRDRNSTS